MLQKIVSKLFKKHHFWRKNGFNELTEIYASQFLRSLAASLVGIFVPIFLYKSGFSVLAICVMFVAWFLSRFLWAYLSAKIIGLLGPKHGIALSVVLQIIYLTFVLTVSNLHWPLWLLGCIGSFAYCLFLMSFNVDFSKVKHTIHGGKELSFVSICERVGAIGGPIIGGLVASYYSPNYTIMLAIVVLFLSLIPIFMSAEPTKTRQKISLKGFPFQRHKRDFFVGAAFQLENVISINIWPLFLGIFVLVTNTYTYLGILASISTLVGIFVVYLIGHLIDDSKGRILLNIGATANAIIHILRPFVSTVGQAFGINIANEPVTAMYRLPFLKGVFDASDDVPGYRIAYYMVFEWYAAAINVIFWVFMCVACIMLTDYRALQLAFVIAAMMSLLITKQRFAALRT